MIDQLGCLVERWGAKRVCLNQSPIPRTQVAKCVPDSDGCALVARCITAHLSEHPDHYVGIHCSYGFNRTGLVCCACTYAW